LRTLDTLYVQTNFTYNKPFQIQKNKIILNKHKATILFEEFVHFDDNVATTYTFSNEKIIQSTTINQYNSENDDEEKETEVFGMSPKEVKCFMLKLHTFFEQSEMDEERCDTILYCYQ
jgi:hypothetical protein